MNKLREGLVPGEPFSSPEEKGFSQKLAFIRFVLLLI